MRSARAGEGPQGQDDRAEGPWAQPVVGEEAGAKRPGARVVGGGGGGGGEWGRGGWDTFRAQASESK